MSTLTNPISKKLHTIKLSQLVEGQTVVTVKATDALYAVVKVLHANHLHSAPVLDANGVCVGVIDMLDIAAYAISVAPDHRDAVAYSRWDSASNPKLALETAGRALTMVPASAVMNQSGKDNYVPLEMDSVATLAVDVFAKGVHRSPILDKQGKVVGTLSQSTLVKWLITECKSFLKNLDALDLYLNDLGLGGSALITVKEDWPVVKVLNVLAAAGVSAVPVVNKAGKMVANFSAVDLVGLYNDNLPKFTQPILSYLKEHAPQTLITEGLTYRDTKLKDLLNYFEAKPHHRVWIVDEQRPTGVVSHTDIMSFIRDYNGN